MKNDLENEVNEKKKINNSNTRPISERLTTWAIWTVTGKGVKLQYKLAQVHALLIRAHA